MTGSESLINIANQFDICAPAARIRPYGCGHINTTFLIETGAQDCPDYVLQKINHHVFRNVPALMRNIQLVTEHLRHKLRQDAKDGLLSEVLTIIPARNGDLFYLDPAGDYWRMYVHIADSISFDVVENPQMAFNGGQAFGRFLSLLADVPASKLHVTIPDFHNINSRLQAFEQAVRKDVFKKADSVPKEIDFVRRRSEEMQLLHRLAAGGEIPERITHNDTKFNNILFDRQMRALCIIDLDTVMPGLIHFDFGDAIRTCANTAAEDEPDVSKVGLNIELFRAYGRGFLSQMAPVLTATEIELLAFSARFMTFIIGLRFLTDYLDGNRYYHIQYPEHNLIRARAQFQLLRSMEEQYDAMRRIIEEEVKQFKN